MSLRAGPPPDATASATRREAAPPTTRVARLALDFVQPKTVFSGCEGDDDGRVQALLGHGPAIARPPAVKGPVADECPPTKARGRIRRMGRIGVEHAPLRPLPRHCRLTARCQSATRVAIFGVCATRHGRFTLRESDRPNSLPATSALDHHDSPCAHAFDRSAPSRATLARQLGNGSAAASANQSLPGFPQQGGLRSCLPLASTWLGCI
jgi:hypothetical protein